MCLNERAGACERDRMPWFRCRNPAFLNSAASSKPNKMYRRVGQHLKRTLNVCSSLFLLSYSVSSRLSAHSATDGAEVEHSHICSELSLNLIQLLTVNQIELFCSMVSLLGNALSSHVVAQDLWRSARATGTCVKIFKRYREVIDTLVIESSFTVESQQAACYILTGSIFSLSLFSHSELPGSAHYWLSVQCSSKFIHSWI